MPRLRSDETPFRSGPPAQIVGTVLLITAAVQFQPDHNLGALLDAPGLTALEPYDAKSPVPQEASGEPLRNRNGPSGPAGP